MRDYKEEFDKRTAFIRKQLENAHADGIIYGNSGGKDCTLVGILCKAACDNTVGLIMPCGTKRNHTEDKEDALTVAEKYGIKTHIVDLGNVKEAMQAAVGGAVKLSDAASSNINPRLRMTALYAAAASENRLVAGTGNRSEGYMGYFTKWGDGAYDFNPIADLTVTEIYEFLDFLKAPEHIRTKAPSAGLFEGQTDESEMGVTYSAIDKYILYGEASERDKKIIGEFHARSEHKRNMPFTYKKD